MALFPLWNIWLSLVEAEADRAGVIEMMAEVAVLVDY
jgi:hypothetical protein